MLSLTCAKNKIILLILVIFYIIDKLELLRFIMTKKHFICTHTWLNEDARKQGTEFTSNMTEREFFDSVKTDKAETLAHWMGKEDFFFCHWYADRADDIMDALD